MIRCIYGCQKWIPDKILHRNSNSIFFLKKNHRKKILLKKNIFENFQKSFSKKYFSFIKFSEEKIFFAKGFLKIFRKTFFHFQHYVFFDENILEPGPQGTRWCRSHRSDFEVFHQTERTNTCQNSVCTRGR